MYKTIFSDIISSMVKVVFFDVDGTLYSHVTHGVPEDTVRCVNKLREQGVKAVICTGRHISTLNKLDLKGLKFDGYITNNGQMCYDGEQNFLKGHELDPVSLDFVISLFNKKEIPITMVDKTHIYINMYTEREAEMYASFGSDMPPVDEYKGGDIYQASAGISIEEEEDFKKLMPPSCKIARWSDCGVDIISSNSGKGVGIKYFLSYLGLDKTEAMAFGDAQNDIEMFDSVGTSIALGNGIDALKEKATYVTSDIDEGGIEKGLKYFNLL